MAQAETVFKNGTTIKESVIIEDTDITLEVGVGANFPAGDNFTFSIVGRRSLGLASIDPDGENDIKTRTWLVLGGVNLRLW